MTSSKEVGETTEYDGEKPRGREGSWKGKRREERDERTKRGGE